MGESLGGYYPGLSVPGLKEAGASKRAFPSPSFSICLSNLEN